MIGLVRILLLLIGIVAILYTIIINTLHRDITRPITHTLTHLLPTLIICISTLLVTWYFKEGGMIRVLLPIKSNMIKNFIAYTMWPTINASIILLATLALHISLIDKLIYMWKPTRSKVRIPYPLSLFITISMTAIAATNLYVILSAENAQTIELARDYLITIGRIAHGVLALISLTLVLLIIIKAIKKKKIAV